MIKRLTNLFRTHNNSAASDTVIIKVRINDQYTFYYPFTAKSGMKVREMSSNEFQQYLASR